jgi:hypothetical protein
VAPIAGGDRGCRYRPAQQAVDRATAKWPRFSQFHATLGEVQRLREDTFEERKSPFKSVIQQDSPQIVQPRKAALMRPQVVVESDDNELIEARGKDDDDFTPEVQPEARPSCSTPTANTSGSAEGGSGEGQGKKRSRASTSDARLRKMAADNRMDVAMKAAELREVAALKVCFIDSATMHTDHQPDECLAGGLCNV